MALRPPRNLPGERLPIGWGKQIGTVDRKWFLDGANEFITDDELKTYVQTMGVTGTEWLKTILAGLDRALEGGPKEKRDREDPQNNSPHCCLPKIGLQPAPRRRSRPQLLLRLFLLLRLLLHLLHLLCIHFDNSAISASHTELIKGTISKLSSVSTLSRTTVICI